MKAYIPGITLSLMNATMRQQRHIRIFFGICRLVRSGAKVLNMSLGTSGNTDPDDPESADSMNAYAGIYSAMMSVLLGSGYDFVAVQSAGNGDINDKAADSFFQSNNWE